jgi:tetratricopeptide (TPR) repeat protein
MTEAASGVQRALEIARTPETLVQNAVLRMMQKDYAAARQSAEEALKASPENVNALKLLAQSYAAQKQTAAGVQRFKAHASQNPKSALVQMVLGEQLLRGGDRAEARKAFEAAKAFKADYTAADLSLAQLDINEGKVDAARTRLSGLMSSPASEIPARQLLAALEERSSNYLEAVEHYRAILARDENNLIALNNLAYMLVEYAKQPDEALKFAEKAKALRPERAEILDTLGWIYYRKGLYPSAVENLEQAVAREETPVRKGHLGLAYFKSGQVDKGRKLVAEAIAMDPRLKDSTFFRTAMAEMR